MSLNRPDLAGRIWYKYFIFSGVVGILYYVFVIGFEVTNRSDAESRAVDPWVAKCHAKYGEDACSKALGDEERGCLRASRYTKFGRQVFKTHVFFECMNERNRDLRLEVPAAVDP